ncbi:DUF418 domain-containing protein [Flavobacterium sp. ANB]|uniref:DUF418 domain-containing protein n=1 Tax=unclassified Flavobacterium TaxID=196869 RepID=UPI0012B75E84|nr:MULTISPECIES: DUF418 domain-containing protein [unclassified Flavobacterium]MBF4515151.1 DUF418 domain-containing protein [Flavobacterium sp. ANB]MTD70063.1 DUF418 domain-containing protein [Flavobacterium sp. LC2016-13]
MTNSYHPLEQSKRTAIVDILRGWAILGVAIGNYSGFQLIGIPHEIKNSILSDILSNFDQYFLAGKSWTLLTILFGYGFAILINNVAAKGKNPVTFFSWRMLLLFGLAFIDSSFWFGDILKDYAFLGLILLLFYKSSARTLAITCAILILATPFIMAYIKGLNIERIAITTDPEYLKLYHSGNWLDFFKFNLVASFYQQIIVPGYAITAHIVMLACMLFGVLLQKINFFNRLNEMKKLLIYVLISSFFISVMMGIGFYFAIENKAGFLKFFHPYFWFILSTMIFVATGICLLYNNGKLKTIFNYFSAGGKMTLTNYMIQNILGAFIFSGIGLGIADTMPYWFYFSLAVFIFIVQLFISKWWLSKYNYGPVEWLWRVLSYRKMFPLKKTIQNNIVTDIKPVL